MGDTTSGSSWETWIQNAGSNLLGGYIKNQTRDPNELQKMQMQALGQNGYYIEGQTGQIRSLNYSSGLPSGTLLLLGAGLIAFMLLKD